MGPQEAVDAPRIHQQWLPDEVFYEPYGLSPDTMALLVGMGYKLVEQSPWGAAELIEMGGLAASARGPASSGNDAALSGKLLPGLIYGANDDRRPGQERRSGIECRGRRLKAPRSGFGGSFETLAALAPQDEVNFFCHARIFLSPRGWPEMNALSSMHYLPQRHSRESGNRSSALSRASDMAPGFRRGDE